MFVIKNKLDISQVYKIQWLHDGYTVEGSTSGQVNQKFSILEAIFEESLILWRTIDEQAYLLTIIDRIIIDQ